MNDWFDLTDVRSYLDSVEFKRYAAAVGEIIDRSGTDGVTIRQIHVTLGDYARREWTLDAIDSLHNISTSGLQPTRYHRG